MKKGKIVWIVDVVYMTGSSGSEMFETKAEAEAYAEAHNKGYEKAYISKTHDIWSRERVKQ